MEGRLRTLCAWLSTREFWRKRDQAPARIISPRPDDPRIRRDLALLRQLDHVHGRCTPLATSRANLDHTFSAHIMIPLIQLEAANVQMLDNHLPAHLYW